MSNTPPKLPPFYTDVDIIDFGIYYEKMRNNHIGFNPTKHFENWQKIKTEPIPSKEVLPLKVIHILYREEHKDGELYDVKFNRSLKIGDGEKVKAAIEAALNEDTVVEDNTKPLVWTDQLVKDFCNYFRNLKPDEVIKDDQIKKLKQSKCPTSTSGEWEILECYHGNNLNTVHDYVTGKGDRPGTDCLKLDTPCDIFSVKRLSDGERFSIGDEVTFSPVQKTKWKIDNFFLKDDGTLLARSKDNFYCEFVDNNLSKLPQPTPLSIHTDNSDVACLSLNDFKDLLRTVCDGTYNDDISRWNFILDNDNNPKSLYQYALQKVKEKLKH